MASPAAPTPNLAARPMTFNDFRIESGMNGVGSKSLTSPAILMGKVDASNALISRTPLRPLTQASQKSSLPIPLGATTPSPVTTTRRMDSEPPSPRMPRPPVQLTYLPWHLWGENFLSVNCYDRTTTHRGAYPENESYSS